MNRRHFLQAIPAGASVSAAATEAGRSPRVSRIDIIHHTHTDVGFTDLPSVCRDMQRRFIDIALDACIADARFRWTIESTLGLHDWWQASPPARRDALVARIAAGQMDAMAFAFNQTPFLNAAQWDQMVNWLPASVWKSVRPRAAMQNDVNGLPRAGALRLLDKGIRHLLMGINADSGGPPFRRPSAFWWKMPDDRRLFVWLGDHYGTAYSFFQPSRWIRQQPRWAQTEYRPPYGSELHATDEASLRAAHKQMASRLEKLRTEGYEYPSLILSYTNQWRYDNDPPLPELGAFVEAWNRLELQPELRLTTATDAVTSMEKEVGGSVPVLEGEWTDWWANGDASGPREVAASRMAKRLVTAASSPVFGPLSTADTRETGAMLRDLCLFDEHTWGANVSISQPYGYQAIGQYTEKSLLAYKPMGHAEALLARRARAKLKAEGLHVANTSGRAWCGWVEFPAPALREPAESIEGMGKRIPLEKLKNGEVRFWLDDLPPESVATFRLRRIKADASPAVEPQVNTDTSGWPVSATWPGMTRSLFDGECANLVAADFSAGNRSSIAKLHGTRDAAERERMRKQMLRFVPAKYGRAEPSHTPYTVVYRQPIVHDRLQNAERRIELWRAQPRARVTIRFDRISSRNPEVLYAIFAFPLRGVLPVVSSGGVPFTPYTDQLPGSCRDYCAIDSWAHYRGEAGDWLWVTRDAPLVAVGGPHTLERRTEAPAEPQRIAAVLFDNCWHTNFVADSHGTMEFGFDLVWSRQIDAPAELAGSLTTQPVVVLNSAGRFAPELQRHLYGS